MKWTSLGIQKLWLQTLQEYKFLEPIIKIEIMKICLMTPEMKLWIIKTINNFTRWLKLRLKASRLLQEDKNKRRSKLFAQKILWQRIINWIWDNQYRILIKVCQLVHDQT